MRNSKRKQDEKSNYEELRENKGNIQVTAVKPKKQHRQKRQQNKQKQRREQNTT